ncbi:MAG: hemerythrin family protein [Magnetococcales bacterium]|nr:hemerythrin family protein [Magnetococcales bacterium]
MSTLLTLAIILIPCSGKLTGWTCPTWIRLNQHKLHAAIQKGENQQVQQSILDRLVTYTTTHFQYEERLLTQQGYPELATHMESHRRLIKRVGQFVERMTKNKENAGYALLGFLKEWLTNHIQKEDRQYVALMLANHVT